MPSQLREYHRPEEWATAVELLHRLDMVTVPLVIGTRPQTELYAGADSVVDLSALNLAYIVTDKQQTIKIGAMTTLQELADSTMLRSQASGILSSAAQFSAHQGLRNLATVGGALFSSLTSEIHLAFLILDASIICETKNGPRSQTLGSPLVSSELVTEINFPQQSPTGLGAAFERTARTPRDQAIVAAAALIEIQGNICRRARLAIAGVDATAVLIESVRSRLEDKPLTMEAMQSAVRVGTFDIQPLSDHNGSAEYRLALAQVLALRALAAAWRKASAQ